MPELRWILIAFGVVLLLAIYVWGRRSAKPADESMLRQRPEPVLETTHDVADEYETPVDATNTVIEDAEEVSPASIDAEPAVSAPRAYVRADIDDPDEPVPDVPASRTDRDRRHVRIEPTLSHESVTAELPAHEAAASEAQPRTPAPDAPTLSMSSTPPPRRIERRKIIALRLATPQRVPGAQLRAALESESLVHGKYDVFHRLDEQGTAIFSIASMVEPGTFALDKMDQETYPGITLFAQLPGPVAGMLAFNELIACSRRLHAALGGTLQDERGVPLTVHRIERIRQEIREFEHRPVAEPAHRSSPTHSGPP